MTSYDQKLIQTLSAKMCINSDKAIRKSNEYMRLLQLRAQSSGLKQFSDTCRIVLCLDLACSTLDIPFDKNDLTRIAGVNKKQYSNGRHLIEKLLDLTPPLTVKTFCVQLGVSEVTGFAQKLLDRFTELSVNGARPIDLSFPMYHCASVFVACKHNKVKFDRAKIIDAARIKSAQFEKLVEDFNPALESLKSTEVRKVATKRSHKLMELIDKYAEESIQDQVKEQKRSKTNNQEEEDFEEWKRRILSEAGDNAC